MKKFIYVILGAVLFWGSISGVDVASATTALSTQTTQKTVYSTPSAIITVEPLEVVKNPQKYLNRMIVMNATFDKFSTLGLDYKPAMRDSQTYIGILIKRDDVINNTIPLSEMKIFLKRDLAEKNMTLESDDVVKITGKVFSTALGDPWIDATNISIVKKAVKKDKK